MERAVIRDVIYGPIIFASPVINQLIQTKLVQRLKGLAQNGLYGLMVIASKNHEHYPTRYDHSIGTAYLCQLLGAPESVQIYALLHDVYHTNFSHDIDYLHDERVSFHETNKQTFFAQMSGTEEIKQIIGPIVFDRLMLTDPGSDMAYINIVKNKQCGADNLDYTLRDAYYNHLIKPTEIQSLISHLMIDDDQIVFKQSTPNHLIQRLIDLSQRLDKEVYNSPENKAHNVLMSRILRLSFEKSLVFESHLLYGEESDQSIMKTILISNDPEIIQLYQFLLNCHFFYGPLETPDEKHFRIKTHLNMRYRHLHPVKVGDPPIHVVTLPSTKVHLWARTKNQMIFGSQINMS